MSEDNATAFPPREGLPIDEDTPRKGRILAWCDHEADPYSDGSSLTLYAAHAEGMGHAPTGFHIIEWGGAFDDSTHEYSGASLPDWWFVAGSEFEVAANPVRWWPLPPELSRTKPEPVTHAVRRTSPFGTAFIGECMLCGETGLRSISALEVCPNPRRVSGDDALIACIEGTS